VSTSPPALRPWHELVAEAEAALGAPASFDDVLSLDEIDATEASADRLREEFNSLHRLDAVEWSVCGAAGVLASLVDVFLVWMPRHPGFLGSPTSNGGPLATWIRERVNANFTPEQIRKLQRESAAPYDFPHSSRLSKRVAGLSPSTHRFQSLGHDPLLGWVFGVKDILCGTFTAIDKNGRWIVQDAPGWDPTAKAVGLFAAIGKVFGHLKSDVATPAGLPVPLLPLLLMFQVGSFGEDGHTLGELSRIMYRSGYDFRHFLAMSTAPLLVEILVRLCYFAKKLKEGHSITDAIPLDLPDGCRQPKLATMLFVAHFIATAANAGKLAITRNPLTINWPQWLAFARYTLPQVKWALFQKEKERSQFVQAALENEWDTVYQCLDSTWHHVFPQAISLG
jgi:hypothetical protein